MIFYVCYRENFCEQLKHIFAYYSRIFVRFHL